MPDKSGGILSRGMPVSRQWPVAVVLAFVALLLVVDPSGSDAAELFRYPLQLNVYAVFATLAATAVAYLLAACLQHLGWHPRKGRLWVWLLVTLVPLLVTGVSFVLSITGPLITLQAAAGEGPQDARALRDPILLLTGFSAYCVVVLGGTWLWWLIKSLRETAQKLAATNQEMLQTLADSSSLVLDVTQPPDDHAATQVALQLGSTSQDGCPKEAYNLSLGGLQKVYLRCLELFQVPVQKAPKLVIVQSSATGPGYQSTRRCGPMITLPRDLSEFVERTMEIARKHSRSASKGEPNALDSSQQTLDCLAAILLHELGHHATNEHRIDLLLHLNQAVFPISWLVSRLLGAERRLSEAREHVCDAEAIRASGRDESFMQAAIQAMDEVLKEQQSRLDLANLKARLQLLGVIAMTGFGSDEVARRLKLIETMPRRYQM